MSTLLAAAALSYCAFIGDSIAVGLATRHEEHCSVEAKVGAGSAYIAQHYKQDPSVIRDYVVISMGSNDPNNPYLEANATALRNSISGALVIWILPYNRNAARAIRNVANTNEGDAVIDLRRYPSYDGVHPSYRAVSSEIMEILWAAFD